MGTSTGTSLWDRIMLHSKKTSKSIRICYETLDVNWLTKINGFSFSYSESHGTEHLRVIHWLLFVLSRENTWDNQQQMTFALVQSKLPNSALMEKSKSPTLMQWDQICCSPSFHMDNVWETTQNPLQFKNQLLSSKTPHIFPDCFKIILAESRVTDNIQHDYVEFRCIQ